MRYGMDVVCGIRLIQGNSSNTNVHGYVAR